MRRALAGVAVAVTSMVALSFLIPLALLVRSEARTRATTVAEQRAAALAPVLALTTRPSEVQQAVAGLGAADQLSVHLPGGDLIGTEHAPGAALDRAARDRETIALDTATGWIYLQPVILPRDRVAVVEAFVPRADLTRGVAVSWGVMAVLAFGLVAGSVVVADRLGARVVKSSRSLSRASLALGAGDLEVRVEPAGPPELQEAGVAFNSMADRVVQLLAMERELVADLSHRLRTPLTALHLESERLESGPGAQRITAAITALETELDSIIAAARSPLAVGSPGSGTATDGGGGAEGGASRGATRTVTAVGSLKARADRGDGRAPRCEVSAVVRARADFWSVLATQEGRDCRVSVTTEPTAVLLPSDDLAAVVDALIGNVFRHTPQGTAFAVVVERTAQTVVLCVEDAGPGIDDPRSALARGVSVGGSTGLGLDIAHRAARATRGETRITRGPMGGARVEVVLGLASDARLRSPGTKRRRSRLPWPGGRRRTARAARTRGAGDELNRAGDGA